ncbi:unnamed protein product [Leptidea sinapis]|uniref:Uncharacterized protein n=1 Tax=Leptidea sinapis TaxID=189913 RepID=A0A5E4PS42_9NEOP|nr:unnamed protein product [Leptidea sinapis]
MLQAYFSDLEKETGLEWHSYSPPEERNVKVAIRGLPTETSTEEITEALNAKQFDVEADKDVPAVYFTCHLERHKIYSQYTG